MWPAPSATGDARLNGRMNGRGHDGGWEDGEVNAEVTTPSDAQVVSRDPPCHGRSDLRWGPPTQRFEDPAALVVAQEDHRGSI